MKGFKVRTAKITNLIGSPFTDTWMLGLDNGEKVTIDPGLGVRQFIGVYSTPSNIIGQQIEYETNNLGNLYRFRPVSID
jgi:hypothetical protein